MIQQTGGHIDNFLVVFIFEFLRFFKISFLLAKARTYAQVVKEVRSKAANDFIELIVVVAAAASLLCWRFVSFRFLSGCLSVLWRKWNSIESFRYSLAFVLLQRDH